MTKCEPVSSLQQYRSLHQKLCKGKDDKYKYKYNDKYKDRDKSKGEDDKEKNKYHDKYNEKDEDSDEEDEEECISDDVEKDAAETTKIQAYLHAQSATLKDDFFRPKMKTVSKKKSVEISQSMFALRRGQMEMNEGQGNVMAVR